MGWRNDRQGEFPMSTKSQLQRDQGMIQLQKQTQISQEIWERNTQALETQENEQ